jgi:DNA adenine methylase
VSKKMKYMGSKNKIAKHILPIMLEHRKEGQTWVEPMVGGANMIDKVKGGRIGADSNEYLIALHKALQGGWKPPGWVSEEDYLYIKNHMDEYHKHYVAFIRFGCSFGAKWSSGYARNVRKDLPNAEFMNRYVRNYCLESKKNMLKQVPNLQGVKYVHANYSDLVIPPNSLIYCDPPYRGASPYKCKFNHDEFWNWCRVMWCDGHTIFVSEYNAPDDFKCVWEQEVNLTISETAGTKAVEKLFMMC